MSPIIRVDDEVYAWLQKHARPFEDTPNSILRKLAGLDASNDQTVMGNKKDFVAKENIESAVKEVSMGYSSPQKNTNLSFPHGMSGNRLNREWKVGARHALYHCDGHFYNNLSYFPGALFDPNGYILFKTEQDYLKCKYLKIGKEKTNVPKGIWSISGYIKIR